MSTPTLIFAILNAVLLMRLQRRLAPLPLLAGTIYMTLGQTVEIGPFHFTVLRILVAIGFVRTFVRREGISGGINILDRSILAWGAWMLLSSWFHKDIASTLVTHLGLAYNALGVYFLLRIFVADVEGVWILARVLLALLMPVAAEMVIERLTGHNHFSIFGGVDELCEVRGGKIRAQGPFLHSILAGTAGAVCLPLSILFWARARRFAIASAVSTIAIVLSSSSSGPILTTCFVSLALAAWKVRDHMRAIRWAIVSLILVLNMIMSVPVYYLLGRIDLTGNSTGWHRAALIESTIKHFDEWWLGGTDYTRHWMPTGVPWSENHTDITNHYIRMAVDGGLPLMVLFVLSLIIGFRMVGTALREGADLGFEHQFFVWTLGAVLFGHAATWMSVSYFDQSVVFPYFIWAAICAVGNTAACRAKESHELVPALDAG